MVTSNPLPGIPIYYRRWMVTSFHLTQAGEYPAKNSIDLHPQAGPGSDTLQSCSLNILNASDRHDGIFVAIGYNATAGTTVRASWRGLYGLAISLRSERPQSENELQ